MIHNIDGYIVCINSYREQFGIYPKKNFLILDKSQTTRTTPQQKKVEWLYIIIPSTKLPHLWWIWNKRQWSIFFFFFYSFPRLSSLKMKAHLNHLIRINTTFLTQSDWSHINFRNVTDRHTWNILDNIICDII